MDGTGERDVDPEVRRAYAYLGAVTERPTAELWDLVDAVGPVEARDRIRAVNHHPCDTTGPRVQVGDSVEHSKVTRHRVPPWR